MISYPLAVGVWEILLIALVILLLFGAKKIPELMKSLGQGVKSFKEGLNEQPEKKEDDRKKESSDPAENKDTEQK